jgi:hypothetical protein
VRLLVLDTVAAEGISAEDRELVQALVTDALRGTDNLLIATDKDVRRRAPMEADRLGDCFDELCLYEMANALDADWVLYSAIRPTAGGVVVQIGTFDRKRGETVDVQTIEAETAAGGSATVTAAMERVIAPILAEAKPQLFETPLFLGGTGVLAAGLLIFAGGGGWALELEGNLADPDRFRADKQRALDRGPYALGVTAVGAAITLVGAGLLTWALVDAP